MLIIEQVGGNGFGGLRLGFVCVIVFLKISWLKRKRQIYVHIKEKEINDMDSK
jgi:hypothetical protein